MAGFTIEVACLLISFAITSNFSNLCLCPSCVTSHADITLVLYSYDRILAEQTNQDSDRLLPYEDPTPESVGDLENVVDMLAIQKCIMIASEDRIAETREQIARQLGDGSRTSLTVAIAGMLEVGAWTAPSHLSASVYWSQPLLHSCNIQNLRLCACIASAN